MSLIWRYISRYNKLFLVNVLGAFGFVFVELGLPTMREFDTYESKKHPESPRGLIFFVKFIGYILRDLA